MTYATKKKLATILMKHQELDIELLQEKNTREKKFAATLKRGQQDDGRQWNVEVPKSIRNHDL